MRWKGECGRKGEVCQNMWTLGGVEGRGVSERVGIRWSGRERCVRTCGH